MVNASYHKPNDNHFPHWIFSNVCHFTNRIEILGISNRTIYGWLRVDSNDDVISILKYNKLKRENEELKWLIGELTLDLKREKKD